MTQKNIYYMLYKIFTNSDINFFCINFIRYMFNQNILIYCYYINIFNLKKKNIKKIKHYYELPYNFFSNKTYKTPFFLHKYYYSNTISVFYFFTVNFFSNSFVNIHSYKYNILSLKKDFKFVVKKLDRSKLYYTGHNLLYLNNFFTDCKKLYNIKNINISKIKKKKFPFQKFFKKKNLINSLCYFISENIFYTFSYNRLLKLEKKLSSMYEFNSTPIYKSSYNTSLKINYINIIDKNYYSHENIINRNKLSNIFFNYLILCDEIKFTLLKNIKIFSYESIFLIYYFQLLINNIISLNFKYYRINYIKGIQPYGYRFVNRKRFFHLPVFELYDLYKLLIILYKTMDINLLKIWIKRSFEKISYKKHKLLCYLLRFYLKRLFLVYRRYTFCNGFFLRIKGKIAVGGNSRKRSFIVKSGKRSFTQKNLKLFYTDFFLLTQTGILGVKFLFSFS